MILNSFLGFFDFARYATEIEKPEVLELGLFIIGRGRCDLEGRGADCIALVVS